MRLGYGATFQNPGQEITDREVYREEIRLARLAEPLGFDSVWSTEHHVTGYQMCPDVLQFLSYMAGTSDTLELGSMVVVIPWHRNPARVSLQDGCANAAASLLPLRSYPKWVGLTGTIPSKRTLTRQTGQSVYPRFPKSLCVRLRCRRAT